MSSIASVVNPVAYERARGHVSMPLPPVSAPTNVRLPTLDEVVARHIRKALEASDGQVEGPRGAATLLRVNPHTLRARMKKLKIDWSSYRGARA